MHLSRVKFSYEIYWIVGSEAPPKPILDGDVPVTGLTAASSAFVNAVPPAPMTCEVFAFCDTKTAMIATPTIAVATVTKDVIN
jgi:hypothetical protein